MKVLSRVLVFECLDMCNVWPLCSVPMIRETNIFRNMQYQLKIELFSFPSALAWHRLIQFRLKWPTAEKKWKFSENLPPPVRIVRRQRNGTFPKIRYRYNSLSFVRLRFMDQAFPITPLHMKRFSDFFPLSAHSSSLSYQPQPIRFTNSDVLYTIPEY